MRKIGGHVSIAGGITNAVKNTQTINGNCMQFFAGSPRSWARQLFSAESVAAFNKLVADHELSPIFIHALYLINLASDNRDTLSKSMESLVTDLKNSELINGAGVVVHLGSHPGQFSEIQEKLVQRITVLLNQAPNAIFIMENTSGQKSKIGTLEQLSALLKDAAHPRLKVCLDTAHLFEAGYDLSKPEGTEQIIAQLESLDILPHLSLIHLNESRTAYASHHDIHANLDDGMIGQSGLSYFVSHPKLQHLPLVLEVPGKGEPSKGPDAANIQIAHTLVGEA